MAFLQMIYYGVPGTGKSYSVDQLKGVATAPDEQVFRVTFHPEYTYSDFIGQLLPVVKEDLITYDFQLGIFTQALVQAFKDTSKPVYLIIEEMSRGNVAAIFGDIFQLLDRNEKNVSRYPIRNSLVAKNIRQISNDVIYFPANFNIIGTVNTSDQNVFAMDTAFKRRFDWKYVSTNPVRNEEGELLQDYNVPITLYYGDKLIKTNWYEFYLKLNKFITDKNNGLGLREDKQIGQFFIQFSTRMNEKKIKDKFQNKLLQYLWDDVESVSYNRAIKLFSEEITNFSELFSTFDKELQIFSNIFLEYYIHCDIPEEILN
ncbi:AAA family ATPase [Marinilactibacillus sp. Marseille-P9653]|uniref:AAA family ATPase n=1 Tax=Marinilactibacillus sp. Marseille-P9653 TaxID=2866583 RepID=UPI001CE46514|nr:AAA family ATPase [Marinilactibacillus sp. Marseille-P9653]